MIFLFNTNYNYDIESITEYTYEYIHERWGRCSQIFNDEEKLKLNQVSMKKVKEIHSHYFYDGKLYYYVFDDKKKVKHAFNIENCFAFKLFHKVHDYLFLTLDDRTKDISSSVKNFELMKFIKCFKPYLNPKVDFFKLRKNKATYKESNQFVNPNADKYYDELDFEFTFFLTHYIKYGVTIRKNDKINHFDLGSFEFYSNEWYSIMFTNHF